MSDNIEKRAAYMWLAVAVMAFVFLMTITFGALWNDNDNVREKEHTKRDRIAACVTSNDVVGCLNAAETKR